MSGGKSARLTPLAEKWPAAIACCREVGRAKAARRRRPQQPRVGPTSRTAAHREAEAAYRRALELTARSPRRACSISARCTRSWARWPRRKPVIREAEIRHPRSPLPLARRAMLARGRLSDADRDRLRIDLYRPVAPAGADEPALRPGPCGRCAAANTPRPLPAWSRPTPWPTSGAGAADETYDARRALPVRRSADRRPSRRSCSSVWPAPATTRPSRSSSSACRAPARRWSSRCWPVIRRCSAPANCPGAAGDGRAADHGGRPEDMAACLPALEGRRPPAARGYRRRTRIARPQRPWKGIYSVSWSRRSTPSGVHRPHGTPAGAGRGQDAGQLSLSRPYALYVPAGDTHPRRAATRATWPSRAG